jgi:hypothetical protein
MGRMGKCNLAPGILNLGTRLWLVANFTFYLYYLRGKNSLYSLNNRLSARGAGQNAAAERKIFTFAGNQSFFYPVVWRSVS